MLSMSVLKLPWSVRNKGTKMPRFSLREKKNARSRLSYSHAPSPPPPSPTHEMGLDCHVTANVRIMWLRLPELGWVYPWRYLSLPPKSRTISTDFHGKFSLPLVNFRSLHPLGEKWHETKNYFRPLWDWLPATSSRSIILVHALGG